MLGRAKEKADDQSLSAEFRIDDAENLSFEDETFDTVINGAALPIMDSTTSGALKQSR